MAILKRVMTYACHLVIVLAAGFLFTACDQTDDQTIVKPDEFQVANPMPARRPFAQINAGHKVLMAVIDDGVDYNHPVLAQNLHFRLDSSGSPTGLGFDFVGNDHWPAPYVVSTSRYDPEVSPSDRALAEAKMRAYGRFLQRAPDLARISDPRRNLQQESDASSYHGTHVAALMTYDRPDFGLMSYRVLPLPKTGRLTKIGESLFATMVLKAVEVAVGEGARIINLSVGETFVKPGKGEPRRDYRRQLHWVDKFRQFAAAHPQVLFVIAAGNEGQWMDGDNRLNFPCTAPSTNILCVGALRTNGEPANFTNIILAPATLVFAFGEDVMSASPTGMCVQPGMEWDDLFDEKGNLARGVDENIQVLTDSCLRRRIGWMRLSGTSMSSPLVAHVAGEILATNLSLTGAQLIQEIMRRSISGNIGVLPIKKVPLKRPSWYLGNFGGLTATSSLIH